jgi:alpha-L-rhamnosidase
MYRYAAGIDTIASDPGFHTIYLHPAFDARLGSLDFTYNSPYGVIMSKWKMAGSDVTWDLTIPPNSTGMLPLDLVETYSMTINGQSLGKSREVLSKSGYYILPAGSYSFKAPMKSQRP